MSGEAPRSLPLALFFSACGDALLALPIQHSFVLGLGAFLIAQLTYAAIFMRHHQIVGAAPKIRLALVVLYLALLSAFLLPMTGDMLIPVAFYMLAIGLMAAGAATHRPPAALLFSGAVIFVLSDSMIAVERFIGPFEGSRHAVMSTYYTAQVLLTCGIIRFHERKRRTLP